MSEQSEKRMKSLTKRLDKSIADARKAMESIEVEPGQYDGCTIIAAIDRLEKALKLMGEIDSEKRKQKVTEI